MLSNRRKPRVLVAADPGAATRMSRILEGSQFERPASLGQLAHAVRCSAFDLVIVDCDFDGSRATEALKMVRSHNPHVPLACVRAAPFCSPLGEGTLLAFQAAAEELGADCFVDLLKFPDDPAGDARVRAMLGRLFFVT